MIRTGRAEGDRGYRGRAERAIARGEYTAPGTKPNATDPAKVRGKLAARKEHA
uniref:Uncharacterized protein n=1 Tax=viral metagenome TaxID=1070528 RepID=A0A6M3JHM1_9ZZZZ